MGQLEASHHLPAERALWRPDREQGSGLPANTGDVVRIPQTRESDARSGHSREIRRTLIWHSACTSRQVRSRRNGMTRSSRAETRALRMGRLLTSTAEPVQGELRCTDPSRAGASSQATAPNLSSCWRSSWETGRPERTRSTCTGRDTDPQEYWSAGIFESRNAYTSNSASPDTTGNYERTRTDGVRFRVARRGDRHFALSTAPEGLAPHLASGDHCLPDADFPPRIECASLNP